MFESTLTHRALHSRVPPTDVFKKIFLAKLMRDCSLAHRLHQTVAAFPNDNYLVICNPAHMAYGFGIPKAIFTKSDKIA